MKRNRSELVKFGKLVDEYSESIMSLNYHITDTDNKFALMVFVLEHRIGNFVKTYSPTRGIKSCKVNIKDHYDVESVFKELRIKCKDAVNLSERFKIIKEVEK